MRRRRPDLAAATALVFVSLPFLILAILIILKALNT
ncbi:hypothetical protein PP641_gp006 [Arthrobacter phage SilentRX]|uniref:Uncharacterized protein n=1 Tax=Arthrobacter phage SilentRX TaxID=2836091 RepID=A0A8F3E803_9CAUD|nr:hypothetical protein PP641_gp006 [Arthrobacter phage SilentRX]QWY82842.1 hypothetical protein SEA_SILENTRX_6 [Arthrobacter phage SilentRX]